MKARVLKGFFDIEEGRDRREGEVFEATSERIAEIEGRLEGYVEPVAEARRKTAARKAPVKR